MSRLGTTILAVCLMAPGVALAGPLHDAARAGDLPLVEKLIAEGVPVDDRDDLGETPLMAAALAGQTLIVEKLAARYHADVTARNDRGMTALHAAAFNGDLMSVEYIVYRGGADMDDAQSKFGVTPLIVAAEENNGMVLAYLVSYGADKEITERHGYTALTRAGYHGHDEIITMLLTAGAACQEIDPIWFKECSARKAALHH